MQPYRKVKQLDPVVAAYLAGLVDGEGTVTLTRQHRKEKRRLVVCISNNELEILKFAKDKIGAAVNGPWHRVLSPYHSSQKKGLD